MTPAQTARKAFVDNYRKLQPFFGSSFLAILKDECETKEEAFDGLGLFFDYLAAPAQMWDDVDNDTRDQLWLAIIHSANKKSKAVKSEAKKYKELKKAWSKIDPNDDKDPSSAPAVVNVSNIVTDDNFDAAESDDDNTDDGWRY